MLSHQKWFLWFLGVYLCDIVAVCVCSNFRLQIKSKRMQAEINQIWGLLLAVHKHIRYAVHVCSDTSPFKGFIHSLRFITWKQNVFLKIFWQPFGCFLGLCWLFADTLPGFSIFNVLSQVYPNYCESAYRKMTGYPTWCLCLCWLAVASGDRCIVKWDPYWSVCLGSSWRKSSWLY